jgi:hypothetical protein
VWIDNFKRDQEKMILQFFTYRKVLTNFGKYYSVEKPLESIKTTEEAVQSAYHFAARSTILRYRRKINMHI